MYNNLKVLAIIPARGGSKGIKHKNITDVAGLPLIAYSIIAARRSTIIDKIVVSTDDSDIKKVSLDYGAEVPFLRPASLSGDTSRTIDCMLHAIDFYKTNGESYDVVVLLQPTQPIRTGELIDEAIMKLIDSDEESLVSVCPVNEHPILMRTINNNRLASIMNQSSTIRRQDMPAVYKVNGVIYVNRINDNFNSTTSLNDNILPFIMNSEESIDIDTVADLERAESYIHTHPVMLN